MIGRNMGTADVTRLVIPSRLSEAPAVQDRLLEQVQEKRYPQEAVFAIRLAFDEALTNAIRHGNCSDPAKKVVVEWSITDQQVKITITDEGFGFKPDALPDPTADENLTCPGGRGVLLMHAYMTEVCFNKRGNRVTMTKHRNCAKPTAG